MEKIYLYVLLILSMLTVSCKTYQASSESQSDLKIERRLENEQVVCYIHDSVVVVRNDTAVVRETKWRDRIVEHTITKVDTVQVEVEKVVSEEKIVEKKVIPKLAWYAIAYAAVMTILIILWIILKIKRVI